ncbi:hypothetical protein EX30DRAFT_324153 [Ascodesmis nigricans]|uniref:MICOS complex subunit n=1 Tax=Ascodesmis nigricans TaxID=341454 RepID=A0A4S2MJ52_9PEZI|nr:hypothetical protein EX30DRAFT_324153 [Ascodesmis nigricans]
MASHLLQRAAIPAATLTTLLLTSSPILADDGRTHHEKKPIYDAPPALLSPLPATPTTPTPTDRLASYIRVLRLHINTLYSLSSTHASLAYSHYLHYEHRVSSAIAGLAPKDEAVMPGALYVALSSMAGGILVRKRNVLVRGTVPILVAIAAGEVFIPQTMRNTGRLVRSWEERVPVVQKAHDDVEREVVGAWRRGRKTWGVWDEAVRGKVVEVKRAVEDLVKKG